MFGDYPTEGWPFWMALAGIAALGAIGVILMMVLKL